jgi:hypothetical protein
VRRRNGGPTVAVAVNQRGCGEAMAQAAFLGHCPNPLNIREMTGYDLAGQDPCPTTVARGPEPICASYSRRCPRRNQGREPSAQWVGVLVRKARVLPSSIRRFQSLNNSVLGLQAGVLPYLSYAGPDEGALRKIGSWGYKCEVEPDRFERVWRENPRLTGLHPAPPPIYALAARIEILSIPNSEGGARPERVFSC